MSERKSGKIDTESVKLAVDFIERRYGGVKTGAAFEAESGISAETYRKWRDGVSAPGWRHAMTMVKCFGALFLVAVMSDVSDDIKAAARSEMARKLNERIERDQQELKRLTGF